MWNTCVTNCSLQYIVELVRSSPIDSDQVNNHMHTPIAFRNCLAQGSSGLNGQKLVEWGKALFEEARGDPRVCTSYGCLSVIAYSFL